MNEMETKSFEVVPVMIEVIDNQTGSKSIIRKYYSLGRKKNGDKYFKITGIAEFYKLHAKNLQKDALVIILPKDLLLQQANSVELHVRIADNIYLREEEKVGVIKYWQESYKGHLSSNWIERTIEGMKVVIKQPKQPKTIDLKIEPKYFEAQEKGDKNFEIRKNDRGYQVGDLLFLHEYENNQYTGRILVRKITYITSYKQKEGYVVLGTKRASKNEEEKLKRDYMQLTFYSLH